MDKVIEEGNMLIAEFMGHGGGISDIWNNKPANYHSDWSWLMPVVVKCKKVYYESDCINTTLKLFHYNSELMGSPIQAFYDAVIQFINWYNNIKQP